MKPAANFEATLTVVRELSENATLRPAPRVLRCVPVPATYILQPVPVWKRRYFQIIEAFADSQSA